MKTTTGHLTLKDIAELAQVSRPAVSNWRKRYSNFPEPVPESTPRKPLFEAKTVVSWLKQNNFFPADAERNLLLASLWAVSNLLRSYVPMEEIPFIVLTLLALKKDPSFKPPTGFGEATSAINQDVLDEVERGIDAIDVQNYALAAGEVVDRFLGLGARGDRSQYGTTTSLSNATLIAAASTNTEDAQIVLDPACGIAGTLLGVGQATSKAQLLGVERNPRIAELARLLTYLTESQAIIRTDDALLSDPFADTKADLVVCEPPLAMRFSRSDLNHLEQTYGPLRGLHSEDIFLLYAAQHLSPKGHAYVLTGLGSTFRRPLKEHRQQLIAQGHIEAVIELPAGLYSATRIPAVLWVLSAQKVENPLLIDASSLAPEAIPAQVAGWLTAARNREVTDVPHKTVTLADVVTNDGVITPSKYLAEPICVDQAEVKYNAALQSLKTTSRKFMNIRTSSVNADAIPTSSTSIFLADLIKDGHFKRINGTYRADQHLETGGVFLARANRNAAPAFVDDYESTDVLRPGDILMPRMGGLPAWVHQEDNKKWVPSDSLIVLRPTSEEYDSNFIVACLNAPANIDSRGTVPKRLPVARIAVPQLDSEQRAVIAEAHRSFDNARVVARQLEHEAEQASDALLNLVFSRK